MSIYDRFRVLFDESLSVYDPATAGGSLFTIFALCGIFLLLSKRQQDKRIAKSFVIPSLFICLFTINPILMHYLLKLSIASSEKVLRLSRLYWVFPFVPVIIYCLIEALSSLNEKWKKVFLSAALLLLLFWGTDGTVLQHYSIADNPYKVPKYTVELSDMIREEKEEERPTVAAPYGVLHWFRQYDSNIIVADGRLGNGVGYLPFEGDTLSAENIAEVFSEDPYVDFIVIDSAKPCDGSLEDYGFALVGTSGNFDLYKRVE